MAPTTNRLIRVDVSAEVTQDQPTDVTLVYEAVDDGQQVSIDVGGKFSVDPTIVDNLPTGENCSKTVSVTWSGAAGVCQTTFALGNSIPKRITVVPAEDHSIASPSMLLAGKASPFRFDYSALRDGAIKVSVEPQAYFSVSPSSVKIKGGEGTHEVEITVARRGDKKPSKCVAVFDLNGLVKRHPLVIK